MCVMYNVNSPGKQFWYFKIQRKTIDMTTRLCGINPTNSKVYSPEPRADQVYCLTLNFKISKLGYSGMAIIIDFSIIAQVIIEMRALWLVENHIISRYNHLARGDYNTKVLIFKMAAARFLDVL